MSNSLVSFAVGASMRQGSFAALVLKFRFKNGSDLLTVWPRPAVPKLLQVLREYQQYLLAASVHLDADAIEATIRKEAPLLSSEEVEAPSVQSFVEKIAGHVSANHTLGLSLTFAQGGGLNTVLVLPNHGEWLLGFICNTLNEFDEDGGLNVPDGARH